MNGPRLALLACLVLTAFVPEAPAARLDRELRPASLVFLPNTGVQDPSVGYTLLGRDLSVELRDGGVRLVVADPRLMARDLHEIGLDVGRLAPEGDESFVDPDLLATRGVDVTFAGARADLAPEGVDPGAAIVSSFTGTPDEWRVGLPTHRRVVYRDAWPGIDVAWNGAGDELKYEFTVDAGADPRAIRLLVSGADDVRVDADGALAIVTKGRTLRDAAPVSWQDVDGERVLRETAYRVSGKAGAFEVTFDVADVDPSLPLVVDPAVFVYATFLGSSIGDRGLGVALDPAGNAYLCGEAPNGANGYDAYVAKYDPAGTTLLYLGFVGGNQYDAAYDIAVDAAGQAYITGSARSAQPSFPAFMGPDVTYNGAQSDAFVAKINAAGTALVYCGYIGGNQFDFAEGIRVDASGAAYVEGVVGSAEDTFPVKVGPDLTYNGRYDTFVCKIVPSPTNANVLDNFAYCGYIGGRSTDVGVSGGFYTDGHIAIDGAGAAYVSGMTKSDEKSFPDGDGFGALPGWDKTHAGGGYDGYVVKVTPSGSGLAYAGYIGGRKSDECFGMGVDAAGNAYVTGDTTSPETTFPVTMGPDLTYNGDRDAFVAKINAGGTSLVYCGYIGGDDLEQGLGLAVDAAGHASVIGHTHSSEATFPAVSGPDLTFNGTGRDVGDAYLARIVLVPNSPVVTANFDSCGYIGGTGEDSSYWVAVDGAGNAYVAGDTDSSQSTFPDGDGFGAVPGNDQTANGDFDAFLVKISP